MGKKNKRQKNDFYFFGKRKQNKRDFTVSSDDYLFKQNRIEWNGMGENILIFANNS